MSEVHGRRHRISAAGFDAVVAEVGASLVSLTGPDGRHLVRTTPAGRLREGCNGAILAPWPNRIRDGVYSFRGTEHRLPLTEPERNNAAHGLALWERWALRERGEEPGRAWAEFTLALVPQPGYPFEVELAARYEVDSAGLEWSVEARNVGGNAAPFAVAGHPYLVADGLSGEEPGALDAWSLEVPAQTYLEADPERLLPVAERDVRGTRFDLRSGRRLGGEAYDVAFTDLERDDVGLARCVLRGPDGRGVELTCGPEIRWVQVYTDDQGVPGTGRRAVAVEPMTAPADAFNSGRDLTVLEPGESHRAWWRIGPHNA